MSFRDASLRVSYDTRDGGVYDGALAVLAGSLDNRFQLADALDVPRSTAPHALVAAAHRRWGRAMLSRLRGAFALLVWDSGGREGLIAVDQLGAGSVVYRQSSKGLAFAPEVRDLLPLLDTAPSPDERVLVRWLVDGNREPGETLLAGVERLAGGHVLGLGSAAHEPMPYWAPRYGRSRASKRADATMELRAGLTQATERGCARGGPSGILLSGGLDSSAVAAVALSAGASLVAYSAVFPAHPATDESALVAERARVLGLAIGGVSFRRGGSLAASFRYLDSWKLPPASPNLFFHEPLLRLASREGMATMLDGQGGDELFGLSPYLAADRLRGGRLVETRRLLRLLLDPKDAEESAARRHVLREVALKGAIPAWLHELRRRRRPERYAPRWLTDEAAELHAGGRSPWAWKGTAGPRWWAYLADAVTRGRERAGAHDFFRHAFADAGLAGSHPLLEDVDLVETVLALPPELAFDRQYDRPLLREALTGLLPDPIRLRAEKSFFNDVLADAVHVEDDAAIGRLLDDRAEIRRYVRSDLFDRLRAVAPARRGRRETWLLWRLAVAECWLRMQAAPEFAREVLERWELAEPVFELLPSRSL
ncbi:MAG: asparagine synthase-related protein [Gaiellaceae bacterium MAG52_C11]|nr:asparagine synthase-related protein [Candidatus Gaiellasilicea maunaloa]